MSLSEEDKQWIQARLDAAAHSTSVDIGHVHTEIQALHGRMTKMQANITTCLELLTRQSRWHDETDASAAALLARVNDLERRFVELQRKVEGEAGAPPPG
jgi:site-specific recombinase